MKKVIITGGSRGIGRACVERFAENGDKVVFFYKNNEAKANELCAEYPNVSKIKADVSDPDSIKEAVAKAIEIMDGVDILVNNAGVSLVGLAQDLKDEEYRIVTDTNFGGTVFACREVIPSFVKKQKGAIVNISSMWGRCGASMEALYSGTKAAVIGYTKALAKELGPSGIRVNCICPGVIDTDMNKCFDKDTLNELASETPLMRLGTPEDVANAVFFLCGDEASFITGQILSVDGGMI